MRGGKWRGRLSLGQIEEQATQKIAEFQRRLQLAGLSVPEIPPIPAEYIALTITELGVRGVDNLTHENRHLSGLLDMERGEILYEEADIAGRQNFTVAHELGHYFLHYMPAVAMAQQPTLFDDMLHIELDDKLERSDKPSARYFRCSEAVVAAADSSEEEVTETTSGRVGRRELEDSDSRAYLAKIIRLKELDDRIEWEANIFARGLLMPSELIRWLNKKHSGDVEVIANTLGVTQTALRYRLNGLGLRQDDNMGIFSSIRSKNGSPKQGTFF